MYLGTSKLQLKLGCDPRLDKDLRFFKDSSTLPNKVFTFHSADITFSCGTWRHMSDPWC